MWVVVKRALWNWFVPLPRYCRPTGRAVSLPPGSLDLYTEKIRALGTEHELFQRRMEKESVIQLER